MQWPDSRSYYMLMHSQWVCQNPISIQIELISPKNGSQQISNTLAKMDFCYSTNAFLPWYCSFTIYYFTISHLISFLSLSFNLSLAAISLSVIFLWKFVNLLWFVVLLLWKFINLLCFFLLKLLGSVDEVAVGFFWVLVWFQLSRK